MRRLFIVEDTFVIDGHGLVPFPGIRPEGQERFHIGDPLLLQRPDGSKLRVSIAGLELMAPNPRNDVVVLLKGVESSDVPVGTEVWSVDES